MNPSQASTGTALAAYCALLNNGIAKALSGTQPASPEDALAGNTELCSITLAATAFAAPAYGGQRHFHGRQFQP